MNFLIPTLVLSLFSSVSVAQIVDPAVHTLEKNRKEKIKSLNPEYLVFEPKEKAPASGIPLVIYLHGAGGVGENIRRIKGQPKKVWSGLKKFNKGPCFVVAPQCLKRPAEGPKAGWLPDDLNLLLEDVLAKFPIDRQRIYLTGNSMGGYGSWIWGGHNPEHFAAIAPVVGGIGPGGPKDVTPDLDKWAANLAKVPVYAFAGANDRVVPAERSERMIAAIKKAGGKNAKIKVYPNEGHGAGKVAFSSKEYYDWMFSQSRKAPDKKD